MAKLTRGVKKVNEKIIQEGRALIITDKSAAEWEDIPYGSLHVDPLSGDFYIKIHGEDDWKRVEFSIGGGSDKNIWESPEDIPYGDLTREQVAQMILSMRNRIQIAENMTFGKLSTWQTSSNQSEEIRIMRRKLIEMFEAIHKGASIVFAAMVATDMASAFNVLETGLSVYMGAIIGTNAGSIALIRISVDEILEIIYPGNYTFINPNDIYEIARAIRDIYEIIGETSPSWLKESTLVAMPTVDVIDNATKAITEIREIIYKEEQAKAAYSGMSLEMASQPETEMLNRIEELEGQIQRLTQLLEKS